MRTFGLPKADLLALLQLKEAVVVSFTAAVNEGPAGLNLTVKVPAQSVSSTAPLLHGQQAQVCRSCTTHTNTHAHEECACIDMKKEHTHNEKRLGQAKRSRGREAMKSDRGPKTSIHDQNSIKTNLLMSIILHFLDAK